MPEMGDRALVLHGGGSVGNAWEIGVIAGMYAAQMDLALADLIIGTSAGATAGAQISGASPTELYATILSQAQTETVRPAPIRPVSDHMEVTSRIIAAAHDAADMRRRMGKAALEMDSGTDGKGQKAWRAVVAARLPRLEWPNQRLLITAVEANSGEPVAFDRHSGVELVDAVAASTSNGFGIPPYTIGDKRYIDGGYRRNENADLAEGYARILVLSPFGGRSRHPEEWGMQLAAQVDELTAGGSRVETVFPDHDSLRVFGDNMMDMSRRPSSAQAGYNQGKAAAERLNDFWL